MRFIDFVGRKHVGLVKDGGFSKATDILQLTNIASYILYIINELQTHNKQLSIHTYTARSPDHDNSNNNIVVVSNITFQCL